MPLEVKDLNPNVLEAQYAVRGPLVVKANEIASDLKQHPQKYPFKKVRFLNIGNPQAQCLKPDRYLREYLALCTDQPLLEQSDEQLEACGFSIEAIKRARDFKQNIGAYTHSQGYSEIRQKIAEFIKRRDGYDVDINSLFLSNGASSSIKDCIQLLAAPNAGFLIPVPQYPLYSAQLALCNIKTYGYHLSEEKWQIDFDELDSLVQDAENDGIRLRAFVLINPSNPTGSVLTEDQIYKIIEFCAKHSLVLFADEVYQANIYSEIPFVSCYKILHQYEEKTHSKGPVVLSFMSSSKGWAGECGVRGGYLHVANVPNFFQTQLYKLASISLCSNTIGQLAIGYVVDPVSTENAKATIESMKRRAKITCDTLNQCEHIRCQTVTGAMYAFPRIYLPEKFIEEAKQEGRNPDEKFCFRLLEEKGICTVAGSGFLQNKNTYHFRMNILEPEEEMESVVKEINNCMDNLWKEYEKK